MDEHVITVDGPLNYPGGKDGLYQARCSCGQYGSAPYGTYAQAAAVGRQHKRDKEAAGHG